MRLSLVVTFKVFFFTRDMVFKLAYAECFEAFLETAMNNSRFWTDKVYFGKVWQGEVINSQCQSFVEWIEVKKEK